MKKRLHFHSENKNFGGSENMLDILINSSAIQSEFTISFSYIHSDEYFEGLKARFKEINFVVYPIQSKLKYPNFKTTNLSYFSKIRNASMKYIIDCINCVYLTKVFIHLLKQINPNIIHINNGGYPGALSCRILPIISNVFRQSRTILIINNKPVDYSSFNRKFERPLDFLIAKSVDKFVTGSTETAKSLKCVLNLSQDKIQVIHNATRIREVIEVREETLIRLNLCDFSGLIFGVISDFVPRKGHLFLLESLARIKRSGFFQRHSCIFIFEGVGSELSNIQEKISMLGLNDVVKLIGREMRIFEILKIIDILIFPSIDFEDLPNVVTEAMSVGKPIIATKIGGTNSQIEHMESGILIEINNNLELENAILELATNKNLRLRMGSRAYDLYLEKFQPEMASQEYLELYSTILKEQNE